MKKLFTLAITAMCLLASNPVKARLGSDSSSRPRYLYFGIDFGKTIFANAIQKSARGYTIECIGRTGKKRPEGKQFGLFFALGYSKFSVDTLFPNTDYNCNGWFGKAGLEAVMFSARRIKRDFLVYFGLNLVATHLRNYGNFHIQGNYFNEYVQPYERSYWLYGMQISLGNSFKIYGPLRLAVNFHSSYLINPLEKNSIKSISFYSPGMGISRNYSFTGGVAFQLFYKIK